MSGVNLNGTKSELIDSIQILLMSEEIHLQEIKLLKEHIDKQDREINILKCQNKTLREHMPSCVSLKNIYC